MADKNPASGTATPAVCYGRVSTGQQAEAGHGLSAQRERAEAHCWLAGIAPTVWIADESVPGNVAPDRRPGLARALTMLADGTAKALVVPALDRLGRNTRDILDIADRAQTQRWRLAIVGLVDSGTPEGRAVLTVIAAMAELERGLTRRRTTEGLQAAKRAGKRLGRPPSPHTRAAGARVAALRADGVAWRAIPAALDAERLPRADGTLRPWNVRAARDALTTVTLDAQAEAARRHHTDTTTSDTPD
ncbi:recombinase family protein [Candidatus Poriferisodalis sp.]|uniref:recombinase family protein n=1 Tax=Candidatus Poriferisodalis sp. TaxID=3101277 RepID=UPI003B019BD4